MKPKRIQLRRTKGWKLPPNTVVVSRPSKWGNPYVVGKDGNTISCLFQYHILLCSVMANDENKVMRDAAQRELAGKNLACWCNVRECQKCGKNHTGRRYKICPLCGGKVVPGMCHADELLTVANKWGRWADDFREPCLDCGKPVENRNDTWCKDCQAAGKSSGPVLVCTPQLPKASAAQPNKDYQTPVG